MFHRFSVLREPELRAAPVPDGALVRHVVVLPLRRTLLECLVHVERWRLHGDRVIRNCGSAPGRDVRHSACVSNRPCWSASSYAVWRLR